MPVPVSVSVSVPVPVPVLWLAEVGTKYCRSLRRGLNRGGQSAPAVVRARSAPPKTEVVGVPTEAQKVVAPEN